MHRAAVDRQPGYALLKIGSGTVFELELELVCNQCNKLRIGGLALGITDRIPKESLQRIQIASVPSYFNGVADGSFDSAGRGLKGLCHLRIQNLGDCVDGVPAAHQTATAVTGFVDDL